MSEEVRYIHKVGDKTFLFETYEQPLRTQIEQLKKQLARTEKALELAVEQLDDAKDMLRDAGKNDWAGMIDTSVDYFKARAREMLENE